MSQFPMKIELTKSIKIAAIYLILAGCVGILLPLIGFGPNHAEFQAKSFAFKAGSYARENSINILFLISGIFILNKKMWARKMALVILVISAIYAANSFAWGFSTGAPSSTVRLVALLVLSLCNGLWFYLIYKTKPIEIIKENG